MQRNKVQCKIMQSTEQNELTSIYDGNEQTSTYCSKMS